ncbi:hypothetical protein MVAC_03686 [Mycolicibacterium vaccae ATCC 25954]|uniref:Uncharacterized protein n=1 Tax=Mycolicibacterium vaccae ATCC 25954 TaxID=1194972 RepID=K0UY14_MYCVA|nr:hypothetical protein MVAC_03686 [Mycolicibacterium vaccae ATCC 25954]
MTGSRCSTRPAVRARSTLRSQAACPATKTTSTVSSAIDDTVQYAGGDTVGGAEDSITARLASTANAAVSQVSRVSRVAASVPCRRSTIVLMRQRSSRWLRSCSPMSVKQL